MNYYDLILEIWDKHRGKIIGVFLGLIFGWFAITYGLLKAVFVSICVGLGFYAGKRLDEQVERPEFLSRMFKERR